MEDHEMQRTFENLSNVLTDLARKIDYMTEVTRDLARANGKGNSANMPFNMNYDGARGNIFRGRVREHEASDAQKRTFEERKDKLREENRKRREEINDIPNEAERNRREKRQIERKIADLDSRYGRGEIEEDRYLTERENAETDLRRAVEKLDKTLNKRTSLEEEIAAAEREIAQSFDEHQRESIQKAIDAAWDNMTDTQKRRYSGDKDNFAKAEEARHDFQVRYDERQEASRLIQNSGLENTIPAKIAQKAINRNQRFDNMSEFGRRLSEEGGGRDIANAIFGKGTKMASLATKGLGKFGTSLTKFAGYLGKGPVAAIMVAVDAIKMLGKAAGETANEWKKQTAEFIKFQTEQENLRYEQAKQHLVLENQMEIEMISYRGDMSLKKMDMFTENMIEALEIANERYIKSMEIGTGAITAGVAQNAYNAAEASIDAAAKLSKANLHRETRAMEYGIYGEKRALEAEGKIAGLQADVKVADVTAENAARQSAFRIEQYKLNAINNGISTGGVSGYAKAAFGAFRDEKNNTTTGEYGQGRANEITGRGTNLQSSKEMGLSDIGAGGESKLLSAGLGLVGVDRSGWEAEAGARLENYNEAQRRSVDAIKTKVETFYNKANVEMQYQTELAQKGVEYAQKQSEMVIDTAVAIEKNWLKVTQTVENWLRKFDERMNDLALNVGMWGKDMMSDFKEAQLQSVKEIALKYGKSEEEIARYQNTYTQESGRNKLMSKTDIDKSAALGTLIGDDNMAARYAGEMEFFNKNAEKSVDLIYEEMKAVNKVGLNARKYIKDVTDNLKLANKYNFKEGTKSLREMVKWAQQTKFNMQSLGSMLEKVQEGGIEGVITQSAGFQVLGGMAAINSDPLGMLYDAWSDPQSYAKRMQDMTKGFGTFNKKTGETEFNMPESMQIAQIAKLQGRSPEELREEIARRNQMNHVKASLSGEQKRTLTKEQQDLIANKANFNQETGQWQINTLQNGEITPVNISDITKENIEQMTMVSNDHNERIEQMVGELVSIVAKERGEQTFEQADLAANDYRNTMEHFHKRLTQMHDSYVKNWEDMLANIKVQQDNITANTTSYLNDFATNIKDDTSAIAEQTDAIRGMTKDIGNALGSISVVITNAAIGIQEALQQKLGQELGVRNIESVVAGATGTVNANANESGAVNVDNSQAARVWKKYYNRHSQKDVEQRISELKAGGEKNIKSAFTSGWNDLLDEMEGVGMTSHDNYSWISKEEREKIVKELLEHIPNKDDYKRWDDERNNRDKIKTPMVYHGGDVVTAPGDSSRMFAASNVTSISDGGVKMVSPHRDDTGIFAKTGGPFDTLFNGIFKKINTLYDETIGENGGGILDNFMMPFAEATKQYLSGGGSSSRTDRKSDINVNIGGTLRLDTGNQQVNLIDLLNQNPDLVRKITEMIINQFSRTENGGKYESFSGRYYR